MQKYGHSCMTISSKQQENLIKTGHLNKCEEEIFVQEFNLAHAAAQNSFYDDDVGRVHGDIDLCVEISNINEQIITC